MNTTIKNLLDKPMDRKDFLKHVGIGMLLVGGGGMIVNALKLQEQTGNRQLAVGSRGYGASAYGGSTAASRYQQS